MKRSIPRLTRLNKVIILSKISVHLNSTEYRQRCWDPYSLGFNLTLQSSMSWRKHIVPVYEEASKQFSILKFVTYKLHSSILTSLYKSLIRPLMEYGDVIWNNCCDCEHIINLGQRKTSRFQKSFFPSATNGWNSLDLDVRNSVSLPTFKAKLRSTLFRCCYSKWFDFSFPRRASIYHTRLSLGFSCLREYLFQINLCASPFCECSIDIESVKHFFWFCRRYAAQRNLLLTSAANILDEMWSSSSDANLKKLIFLLYGLKPANYDIILYYNQY